MREYNFSYCIHFVFGIGSLLVGFFSENIFFTVLKIKCFLLIMCVVCVCVCVGGWGVLK